VLLIEFATLLKGEGWPSEERRFHLDRHLNPGARLSPKANQEVGRHRQIHLKEESPAKIFTSRLVFSAKTTCSPVTTKGSESLDWAKSGVGRMSARGKRGNNGSNTMLVACCSGNPRYWPLLLNNGVGKVARDKNVFFIHSGGNTV